MAFRLSPPAVPVRKARIAVDVRVGDVRLGQHADAVVTVVAATV